MVELRTYTLTTHPGLEPIAVEELQAILTTASAGDIEPGRVVFQAAPPEEAKLLRLRSVHHVVRYLARIPLSPPIALDDIRSALDNVEVPDLGGAESFRVRSVRRGRHDFNHMDLERSAGAVLFTRTKIKVDLHRPAVTVRVDLDDDVLWVGILLTPTPLSRRAKTYAQRVGLSADLAYATTHVAGLITPERIVDPFCGSGTLLLEAGALHPGCELWGSDWVPAAVEGTQLNLHAAGLADRMRVRELDALRMADVYPHEAFDAIVTNPPFGLKVGPGINFYRFYHRLLTQARLLLKPEGRLALWVHRHGQFRGALKTFADLEVYRTIRVQTGSVRPTLLAVRRV